MPDLSKDNDRVDEGIASNDDPPQSGNEQEKKESFAKAIGPGVITGASDDDPSGIATYSQAGAQFGLGMLWMVLFQYPLMTAVQEMCARIGLVTGNGLAAVMRKKYPRKVVFPIASLLLIANTVNIGADIGAMTASVRLILPQLPFVAVSLAFTAFIIMSEIIIPYHKYVKVLKYLTLFLFAYVVTTVIVGGSWDDILAATLVPSIQFNAGFAMMFVAIFGTTISPYLFFWQASEEAEEDVDKKKVKEISGPEKPRVSKKEVKLMRADVVIGMAFSQLIMWSIIITASGSLHANGVTNVASAEEAAKALEPLVKTFPNAGVIAKTIFALGIIGTGLLAVPVLAGSCGYALADAFGWKQGLSKKFLQAKYFCLVIAAATSVGLWINFSNINPIQALIYTAVINGVVAVPILFAVIKISNDKNILGNKTNRPLSNILGWTTFAIMAVSVVIMFVTWGR
ncbi:MAG TPA: divalent metal cation transporter [Nitrososphaera sp.]|nr:divalent metal cation transporter [Nitrososphaera sp.]